MAPALVRALRAADAVAQTQSLCDALYCVQAIAGVPDGMERLLRAGAAAAVVSRLAAASGDRTARGAVKADEDRNEGGGSGGGGGSDGGVEETKTGRVGNEAKQAAAAAAAAPGTAACSRSSSPDGFGGGVAEPAGHDGSGNDVSDGGGDGDGPAQRAETLAFAFVGRALEASCGNCLGPRELTAVAEAFRDDPTPAKFSFMDLLLRWSSVLEREEGGGAAPPAAAGGGDGQGTGDNGGVRAWARTRAFPAALREGLLQALHGAAEDERRDSALALLALLLRAAGQEWAVEEEAEDEEEEEGEVKEERSGGGKGKTNRKKKRPPARRKRGTFVAFAVRCAAGEVRILLDEALSLFVPAAARGGAGAANGDGDDDAGPGTGQKARGAMGPAGADPSIGIAAEIAGANARAAAAASATAASAEAAASGADTGAEGDGEGVGGAAPASRAPLPAAQLRAIKEQRAARLLRMVPVGLGVAESTIAFLCGAGDAAPEGGEEGEEGGGGGSRSGRWDELPIDTLQDLQKVREFLLPPPSAGHLSCLLTDYLEAEPNSSASTSWSYFCWYMVNRRQYKYVDKRERKQADPTTS